MLVGCIWKDLFCESRDIPLPNEKGDHCEGDCQSGKGRLDYDLCIVGAGMIGSAAARHASNRPGVRICLIGPDEPKERSYQDGRNIYGAHYDEGRITRSCDVDPVWATLAQESIKRYRELEEKSGVQFFREVGSLVLGTEHNTYTQQVIQNAKLQNVDVKILTNDELKAKLPYMKLANNDIAIYEWKHAGHVSPRKLVEAEQKVAIQQGCSIIREIVQSIEQTTSHDGQTCMKLVTDNGNVITCKNVLIATGAFTTYRKLLPDMEPQQELSPLTVALVEVDITDVPILKDMPSIIYSGHGHTEWSSDFPRFTDGNCGFYLLPPIKYPDGRYYLKLGHFHEILDRKFRLLPEVRKWFIEGDHELSAKTASFIKSIFTGIKLKSWKADQCLIVETPPTFQPYIDKVHPNMGVALGGNGFAAKSCDEIGRLAAGMMFDEWDSQISRAAVKLRAKSRTTKSML